MGIKRVGNPIDITYFPGGMDSPTFMHRREITIHVLLELESLQLYEQDEEHAAEFGAELGRVLHGELSKARAERGNAA